MLNSTSVFGEAKIGGLVGHAQALETTVISGNINIIVNSQYLSVGGLFGVIDNDEI